MSPCKIFGYFSIRARRLPVRVSNANFFHFESQNARSRTRKWCVPRTFPRNPAILRVWSRSTPWAPLLVPENKRISVFFFFFFFLRKDRNATRNVAIIRVRNWRRYARMKKGSLKWNELLKYTSAYKSSNNYRCGQSRGVCHFVLVRLLFQLILSFLFFFFVLNDIPRSR